jgi:hypothetical protein
MIFHIPTGTAIFCPPRTGSTTMRAALGPMEDFVVMGGPAPWDPGSMTFHVGSRSVHSVFQHAVRRRLLLIREPIARAASFWFFQSGVPWDLFAARFTPHREHMPQNLYCQDTDGIIHTETMAADFARHFPDVPSPTFGHHNASDHRGQFNEEQAARLRQAYWLDAKLWASRSVE